MVRGTAQSVPLSVDSGWTFLPSRIRTDRRRAWKPSQLDADVSSRYLPCVGIHASQSNFLEADAPRSPVATSITWKGSSRLVSHCFSHSRSRWCSAAASSGCTYENISTLLNWCTRKMPRVSFPYVPASRR